MEAKQHASTPGKTAEGIGIARVITEHIRTVGLREVCRRVGIIHPATMVSRLQRGGVDFELQELLAVSEALGMRLTLSYEPAGAVGGIELARRATRQRRQGPGR